MNKFASRLSLFAVLRSLFALHALLTYDHSYGNKTPRFILFENPIFSSNAIFHFAESAYYVAIFLFILGIRVEWSGLLAGGLKFLVMFMDFEERWAFAYLPPLAFIAFAIVARTSRNGNLKETPINDATPLILLVSSVYFFACFHKAYNFSIMQAILPGSLAEWFRDGLDAICSGSACDWFWGFVKWSVVPVEGTLGIFFFFAKTRRFAFLLAIAFHLILLTAFDLNWVGIEMLMLEAAAATLQSRMNWASVASKRSTFTLIVPIVVMIALEASLRPIAYEQKNIFLIPYYFLSAIMILWPMIWLGTIGFFSSKSSKVTWQPANFAFACVLALFGISVTLSDYNLPQFGWSVFSGAFHNRLNNKYVVRLDSPGCPLRSTYLLVAYRRPDAKGEMVYYSTRKEFLEQLANYAKQTCPETKVTGPFLVSERPDLAPANPYP
jgi:hypothetical protein